MGIEPTADGHTARRPGLKTGAATRRATTPTRAGLPKRYNRLAEGLWRPSESVRCAPKDFPRKARKTSGRPQSYRCNNGNSFANAYYSTLKKEKHSRTKPRHQRQPCAIVLARCWAPQPDA